MKKLEVVRLGVKEKDIYRAFIPNIDMIKTKITKDYLEKNYELCELKVKKIINIEMAEERFGDYVYFKGEK